MARNGGRIRTGFPERGARRHWGIATRFDEAEEFSRSRRTFGAVVSPHASEEYWPGNGVLGELPVIVTPTRLLGTRDVAET
jgi:hypothetical protein